MPYAATKYVARRVGRGVTVGMAAVGEPEENGYAERLMRTIREEEISPAEYEDFADARRQLGRFLDAVYNRQRIHSSLGCLTPVEFEKPWRADQTAAPTAQQTRPRLVSLQGRISPLHKFAATVLILRRQGRGG